MRTDNHFGCVKNWSNHENSKAFLNKKVIPLCLNLKNVVIKNTYVIKMLLCLHSIHTKIETNQKTAV